MANYVTIADVDAFASQYGDTWSGDNATKQAAIDRAQAYLDSLKWIGRKTGGREQTEAWPREAAFDVDGFEIADDEIPHEVIYAASVFSIVELASPNTLTPTVTLNQIAIREKVGEIEVEYAKTAGVNSARPQITRALDYLKPLLIGETQFLARA